MELVTIVFLVLLFLGMPVGFAVGIAGATFFLQHPELPLITMVQLPISQTQNVTLLAVPLFIFAGTLMNASGITRRMVKLAMLLAGHMRGGDGPGQCRAEYADGGLFPGPPMRMQPWRHESLARKWNARAIRKPLPLL